LRREKKPAHFLTLQAELATPGIKHYKRASPEKFSGPTPKACLHRGFYNLYVSVPSPKPTQITVEKNFVYRRFSAHRFSEARASTANGVGFSRLAAVVWLQQVEG
jgi:hypothetical protein